MKELSNAVKSVLHASDVEKKLQTLVDAMEELGGAHDKVTSLLPDGDDGSAEDKWYFGIDCEVNKEIKKTRQHIKNAGNVSTEDKTSGAKSNSS